MGVTQVFLDAHIPFWENQLGKTNRPHRRYWPSRLFRHEPLENAVEIIKVGQLLSRNAAFAQIQRDIAPLNIIANRAFAQDYVRLYFRPRTPTQFHIEGIRKPIDYYNGKHAPVLIIFVFRATNLLATHGAMFSDGNMQSNNTRYGSDDVFFQSINFNHVFHEGPFDNTNPANSDITRVRCAEVLLPSPLHLNTTLEAILCRSPAERSTLIHMLGNLAPAWENRIVVQGAPGLFNNEYVYLDEVSISNDGVNFRFHPTSAYPTVKTELHILGINNATALTLGPWQLDPRTPWVWKHQFPDGIYNVKVNLEDCLAFDVDLVVDSIPF